MQSTLKHSKLRDIQLTRHPSGPAESLQELTCNSEFLLSTDVPVSENVLIYGAVVDTEKRLVNIDDNITFNLNEEVRIGLVHLAIVTFFSADHHLQVHFGQLKACIQTVADQNNYILVQPYDRQTVVNEVDCPILIKLNTLIVIPSTSVVCSISVVHQCTDSCNSILSVPRTSTVEREDVELCGMTFKHDYNNSMYCLNIFCMHTHRLYQ